MVNLLTCKCGKHYEPDYPKSIMCPYCEADRLTAELKVALDEIESITHVAYTADPEGWWIAPRGSSDPSEWIICEEQSVVTRERDKWKVWGERVHAWLLEDIDSTAELLASITESHEILRNYPGKQGGA